METRKSSRREAAAGPPAADVQLLRLECPFCHSEYPLWLREERDIDETLSPAEWERWLGSACTSCGRTPREHLAH